MTDYREILRLSALGFSKQSIADVCRCARNTVRSVLSAAELHGVSWQSCQTLTNEKVKEKLYPKQSCGPQYRMPDYENVHKQMQKSGVTLKLLWLEYCEECRANDEIPYQSTQFNKYYADYIHKTKATMHLEHKPGETMQVDWAGERMGIIDTDTGEVIPVYVFVAVLPYSGYAYAEGFFDQKQDAWIRAHVHAYTFFGGVTRILTPDNLKTGIIKNSKAETVINRTYQEMAEHYGTAILPARPRTPKDKAAAEGTVGIISTWIMAALRKVRFFTLAELNEALWEKLYEFNHKPFQKKDGSRAKDFSEEKLFLMPLPPSPFELATWKTATVQYNYHIAVEKQNYSVPYEYIRRQVDVRLTDKTVEVFFEGGRIASHIRLHGRPNQYSTYDTHMPPDHQKYLQWNADRFIRWAEQLGPHTAIVIRHFLTMHKVEQQGYKPCMALLKLTDTYPPERLENACKKALSYTPRPSYKHIQSILKTGQDKHMVEEKKASSPTSQHGFTRGAAYYRRDN